MYSCTVNRQSQIVAYWPATFAAKNGTLTIKRREKGEHTWAEVLIKLSELIGMVWYGIFGQKYNTYNQVYTSICPFIWIRLREASPPFLVSVCRRTIKDTLLKGVLNLAILTIFTVLYYMAHASTFGIPRKQALRNSCELLRQRKELHTSSGNCIQAHGTACKLM